MPIIISVGHNAIKREKGFSNTLKAQNLPDVPRSVYQGHLLENICQQKEERVRSRQMPAIIGVERRLAGGPGNTLK